MAEALEDPVLLELQGVTQSVFSKAAGAPHVLSDAWAQLLSKLQSRSE
jgi:hypothetical protein